VGPLLAMAYMEHFLVHLLCVTLLATVAPTPEAVRSFKLSNLRQQRRGAASFVPPPIWQEGKEKSTQVCGKANRVNSSSNKWERCPSSCPVYAEVRPSELHCQFECVPLTVEDCIARNPKAPIPDKKLGLCRSCMIDGCAKCAKDGTDTCLECNRGFARLGSKRCENKAKIVWIIGFCVLGFITLCVIAWLVDLARRPVTNEAGLQHGLALRSRAKLLMPMPHESEPRTPASQADAPQSNAIPTLVMPEPRQRGLWPLNTNLLTTRVAGPGLMLQFNLQFWIIIWAAGVAIAWACTAAFFPDLFILGTRRADTPRQNCILVAWGYETQHALMWVKVAFTFVLYVVSFVLCILFGIRQLRIFQAEDAHETTHKDFSALLTGLPQIGGHEHIEKHLATTVERATSVGVVGVSVCWDFSECEETLMSLIEHELCEREGIPSHRNAEDSHKRGIMRRVVSRVEKAFLSPTTQKVLSKGKKNMRHQRLAKHSINPVHLTPPRESPAPSGNASGAASPMSPVVEVNVEEMLWQLKSCHQAFVVFNSEADRDAAVKAVNEDGLEFRDCSLKLEECDCEPNTVIWKNCTNMKVAEKAMRVVRGLGVILFALAVWVCVFYLPYAHYAMSFNYAYGQEPGGIESFTFGMLVVAGNAAMYLICSEVADYVGFQTVDHREVCYMLLYNFACVFNVALDISITYLVAYSMMVGQNMRTYHGVHLKDVDSFSSRVETYAMQREMGKSLWRYSWPSTFLIPFLIEPIITIYIPYKLMSWVVRSNPRYRSYHAERFLTSTPMDLSRYADVLLNVILAVLILFFPGGYTLGMFATLAVSHVFIYAFDHWRVLRSIPSCEFANMNVDWWAQWLLTVPCGLLLSAAVYKYAVDVKSKGWGYGIVFVVSAAFLGHILLHTALLVWVVPLFGHKEKEPSKMTYKQCGRRIACSWFSANPVHCLRSSYIYRHEPPCDFCVAGKEHLLRVNEDIGLHFTDAPIEAESYDETPVDVRGVLRTISTRFSRSSQPEASAEAASASAKQV